MSNEFKQEDRYIVFKLSDMSAYLSSREADEVRYLNRVVNAGRTREGKESLNGVFIEKHWPEFEPTWEAIKARVTGAQPAPSVPDLLESLRCACNYIDKLGGVSQQYRAMLASPEAKP